MANVAIVCLYSNPISVWIYLCVLVSSVHLPQPSDMCIRGVG